MYYYNDMLNEGAIIEQNEKIRLPLKKHQLAGIYKAYKWNKKKKYIIMMK